MTTFAEARQFLLDHREELGERHSLLTGALGTAVLIGVRAIPLGSTSGVASVTVGIALDTVIASFAALTLALLYFDLRSSPQAPRPAEREYPHLRDLD